MTTLSEALLRDIREEFPGFRLVPKRESALSLIIDRALKILTVGRQNRYLTEYHTVIGSTLYVPESWDRTGDVERTILLRHERVHLRQRRRYGMPLMTVLYLLPILPLFLAIGRAKIEWEAYVETLRATAELQGLHAARSEELRRHIIARFTGPDYGWMWPFPKQLARWYDDALREIERSLSES